MVMRAIENRSSITCRAACPSRAARIACRAAARSRRPEQSRQRGHQQARLAVDERPPAFRPRAWPRPVRRPPSASSSAFESASLSDGIAATATLASSAGTSDRRPVKITRSAMWRRRARLLS